MLSEETIKKLLDYPPFKEFQSWLYERMDNINNLTGIAEMSREEAGDEAKTRDRVFTFVYTLFQPFIENGTKSTPTKEQINKVKEKYGL